MAKQFFKEGLLETSMNCVTFRWLRGIFLPVLFKNPGAYHKPDNYEDSYKVLLHEPKLNHNTWPCSPCCKHTVPCHCLSGQVSHLKWWLVNCFVDCADFTDMDSEKGKGGCTDIQLWFEDSPNPSVFITPVKVYGIHLNITTSNDAVITPKFCISNEHYQIFATIV